MGTLAYWRLKTEGTLKDVQIDITNMMTPENIMDIFQFFTLFATDKKKRLYKVVCRYQQFEGANLIIERVKAAIQRKDLSGISRGLVNLSS